MTPLAFFRWWAENTLKFRWFVLGLASLSVVFSLQLASSRIKFSTDRTQLLDPGHPVQRNWQVYRESFQGNSDLLVLVTGEPEEVRGAVEALGKVVTADKDYFDEVFFKITVPEINQHALYFLSKVELEKMLAQLRHADPWMKSASQGLPGVLNKLRTMRPAQARTELVPMLPLIGNVLKGMNTSIQTRGQAPYVSPMPAYKPETELIEDQSLAVGQSTFYNTIQGDRTCLMLVQPSDRSGSFEHDAETVARLRHLVSQMLRSYPQVNCMVCGELVMNTDEMVGSYRDSQTSGLAAVCMVYVLLTAAFGNWLRPLCAVVSLGVGMAWSLAFTAVTVGDLNLLTVHFATIVAGLSMTFAIQVLCHYLELGGREPTANTSTLLVQTVAETGPSSFIGAITTAVAFWSLHFTNFRAASELGQITGAGVLLCFLSTTTLLPILLQLTEGNKKRASVRLPGWQWWSLPLYRHPYRVMGLSLLLSLYSLTWIPRVPFNYNVLSLQPKDSEVVRLEKFLQSMGYSGLFAVTSAANISEANQLAQRFKALPSVARVETVASLEPLHTEEKRPLIGQIVALASPLSKQQPAPAPRLSGSQLEAMAQTFQTGSDRLRALLATLPPSVPRDNVQKELRHLVELLDPNKPGPISEALTEYQQQLTQDLHRQAEFLSQQSDVVPDILKYLPRALRARTVSPEGRISIRIFPNGNAWDREPLEFFVGQIIQVDPNVTGSPLLIYNYSIELRKAYSVSGRVGLSVISLLLLIHFRSFGNAALAIFPKLLGVLWMVAAMGVFGVSFNSANFLALPITLGIGLIFGVNVLLECQHHGAASLFRGSTGAAVVLSGLTAMLGFSSFLMVQHIGVSSFGFVMAAGVGANLLTSLLTLPALITILKRSPLGSEPE